MPATPYAFGKMTRTPSLSDRVAEQLTEAIVSRQLRAGDRSLFQNLNESELGAVAIRLQACVVPVHASVLLAGFADAGM